MATQQPEPKKSTIRVSWRPPPRAPKPTNDDPLIAQRHRQVAANRRKRLGFWRSIGRSNQLFPRKLIVTREGKWIIGIALLLGAAAVNTGNNLLYLVLSLVISVISVSGMLSELCLRDLELRRRYPVDLIQGEVTTLRIEVHNDKKRAALHLEVGEVLDGAQDVQARDGYLLHLAAGETGQAFAAIRPLRRGPIATAGVHLATSYPFGFATKARVFDEPAEFISLPPVTPVQLPWRGALDRGATELSKRTGHGDSFAGLRDARPGDPLRDIHWKVSARRGRLIVREWQAEAARVALVRFVHVAPGADPTPSALDAACARVGGVCQALLEAGFAVGLQTLDGSVSPAADVQGRGEQLMRIRRLLALLLPADQPPPPEWPLPDDAWAAACRQAEQRARAIASAEPLTWAPVTLSGPAEVFQVEFVGRSDVRTAGRWDVRVALSAAGEVVGVENARAATAGAA